MSGYSAIVMAVRFPTETYHYEDRAEVWGILNE